MGKVTEILEKIRKMGNGELFDRFKHLARAQALREYLNSKNDPSLTIEVNLSGEEILKRMASSHSVYAGLTVETNEEE